VLGSGFSDWEPRLSTENVRPSPHGPGHTVRVLVLGVATRAIAESAANAGFAVTALDRFGDLDQHPHVHGLSIRRDFRRVASPHALAQIAHTLEGDVVAYVSSFENHPILVDGLARRRPIWGNSAGTLVRVRTPGLLARTLLRHGHRSPAVSAGRTLTDRGVARAWLLKPVASGGGHGISKWHTRARPPRGCYLQELIEGTPVSLTFAAAGGRCVSLGLSVQLIGEVAFGASGYRYCGSILLAAGDPLMAPGARLWDASNEIAATVTREFGLIGLNGIDCVVRRGVPYTIEVNPRWCSSMELAERAYGLSLFGAHASACTNGRLPDFDLRRAQAGAKAFGKAIVFARRQVRVGDTTKWLDDISIRDVPHPGEYIPSGAPVCTVFASADDATSCRAALVARANEIYQSLAGWERDHGQHALTEA